MQKEMYKFCVAFRNLGDNEFWIIDYLLHNNSKFEGSISSLARIIGKDACDIAAVTRKLERCNILIRKRTTKRGRMTSLELNLNWETNLMHSEIADRPAIRYGQTHSFGDTIKNKNEK